MFSRLSAILKIYTLFYFIIYIFSNVLDPVDRIHMFLGLPDLDP